MTTNSTGPAILIMAAGVGHRFGGLKQLAPVGPAGEAIIEFSIRDALTAGFTKAILVIRPEFEQAFREKFVDQASQRMDIAFAYQSLETALPDRRRPGNRLKPWGTAHAVLSAKESIACPFAVINADDYYGSSALSAMGRFLASVEPGLPMSGAMVGYELQNTLSDHGTVSRGVCELDAEGMLLRIVERHNVAKSADGGEFLDAAGARHFLPAGTTVSMNLWGYPVEIFGHLERAFVEFLDCPREESQEYEISTVTQQLVEKRLLQIQVLKTKERCCGMTYKNDLRDMQDHIAARISGSSSMLPDGVR